MEPLVKMVLDDGLREAFSARPDAPVVPDDPERDPALPGTRHAVADGLRRLADRIEARPCSRQAMT
jgi:hypothetical protein